MRTLSIEKKVGLGGLGIWLVGKSLGVMLFMGVGMTILIWAAIVSIFEG